ncbi:MAG: Gfo/Idh/MocA family oxidoreductase [Planctomycetes bacterium]|nr:Gfo/Idh/MocA family oxidoreductase [Planctomycetota bacterium]
MNRRDALRVGTAAVLTTLSARAYAAIPTKPRRVGLIGCGWFGKHDLTRLIQIEPVDVVALCDVDQKMMQRAGELIQPRHASKKMPRLYGDYRDMLAEKDLDIVLVATPDHWHALPMIAAVEAGADVYVQKPISLDVLEGKAMVDAARKHNRVVQVGLQRRSKHHLIDAIDQVIREGLLGDIAHVETCCYYHMRRRGNPPVTKPPEWFDYEMWAGPAPKMPYTSMIHPQSWRAFMEYGNGIMGDMCVHMFDIVRWMLDLGWPKRVSSSGGILVQTDSAANIPDTQNATFEFDDLNVLWTMRS